MASRREFVQRGALALGAIAVGREAIAAPATEADPLYAVIYDERFPESAAFAAHATWRGGHTLGLDSGDATRVWYDDLYHRWKQGPAAIAGLTAPSALFVLETFGNDAGLRLQFKGEHRFLPGRVEHRLYGPDVMLRTAHPLASSSSQWSAMLGRTVRCVRRPANFGVAEALLTTQLASEPAFGAKMLVSWVLAPRTRA